ncbi:MAG: cytochrome c biogenesis protein ResB [Clostridia bacterium]|nr:cytochrome c biogenesis protein ResB [Clostridia bacterium]
MKASLKKLRGILSSMKLGIAILVIILALCVAGTLIPQGQNQQYYQQLYGWFAGFIAFAGLDRIYSMWYFAALFGFLCLNLVFCSILRLRCIPARERHLVSAAQQGEVNLPASADEINKAAGGRSSAFLRGRAGLYGSFITHVGLLLLLIAGGCTLALQENFDYNIFTGDSVELSDGTVLRVDAFSVTDDEGNIEYTSDIALTAPDARSLEARIRVNHPARFDEWTIYQQSYGYSAAVNIQNGPDDPGEEVLLDEEAFLTLDGEYGVAYYTMYPDYVADDEGNIAPMSSSSGDMPNPLYLISVIDEGGTQMGYAMMNSVYQVDGVTYTFLPPRAYPGLRVKYLPGWVLPVLYLSFVVLIAGLYICFFITPVAICAKKNGLCVVSARDTDAAVEALLDRLGRDK